jgi:hypothetical protein
MRAAKALLVACLGAFSGSCATDPTEVVLLVDGQFDTPSEIDHLDITITSPNAVSVTATTVFDATSPGFPRTVGIVQDNRLDGDYVVEVIAKFGTTTVVRRRASFTFTQDEIRMLRIDLLRVCMSVSCPGVDRTCGEDGLCERIDQSTTAWHGTPDSHFDAGAAIAPIVAP